MSLDQIGVRISQRGDIWHLANVPVNLKFHFQEDRFLNMLPVGTAALEKIRVCKTGLPSREMQIFNNENSIVFVIKQSV